jgi:hypothetical protein
MITEQLDLPSLWLTHLEVWDAMRIDGIDFMELLKKTNYESIHIMQGCLFINKSLYE